MEDYLTMWSIFLAVASTTLAIGAFIFSWASYRNATAMQIKAQEILSQISQKVEVVVERTTHQIDKAWDYFTGLPSNTLSKSAEEITHKEEELKKQIIEEARKEVHELMKGAGLQKDALKELTDKVKDLVSKSSDKTRQLLQRERLIIIIDKIGEDLREIAAQNGKQMPDGLPLNILLKVFGKLKLSKNINQSALNQIKRLADIRNDDLSKYPENDIQTFFTLSLQIRDYLNIFRKEES
jgi:hypothetical protein